MSKELIVSATRHETRVAILEDDQLVEIFHQREKEYSLAGSIHKGRVTRVLPGMQSAFVDIGLERDAFLYVSDFFEDNEEYDKIVSGVEEKVLKLERGGSGALEAVPITTPIEPELAAVLGAVPGAMVSESAAPAIASPAGPRRDGRPEGGNRERGERGGRGRRSRRRRPEGGLPESKFFSPGSADREARAPREHREFREPREPRETAVIASEITADSTADDLTRGLVVLPGESISKYVGHEALAEESEPDDASEASMLAEEVVREEHMDAPEAVEPVHTSEPETEATVVAVEETPEELVVEVVEVQAEEAADLQVALDIEAIEAEDAESEAELSSEAEGEMEASAEGEDPETDAALAEEGPEPARIPTSLTAALREQGNRLGHRVARRSRRRGGRGGERGERPSSATAEPRTETAAGTEGSMQEEAATVVAEARPDNRRGGRAPREERAERTERPERAERPVVPSISDLLHAGQEIIVQIAKEPLGQKGARITSHVALPGRFLVYMPSVDHIGVSRKIPSDDERLRLKKILQSNRTGIPGGFIVRTAGDGKSEEELRADMNFLYNLWLDMRQKAEKRPAPVLLHHDLDVVERILRDQLTSAFKTVWVDNEIIYEGVLSFVQRFQPAMVGRIKLYTRPTPIFDEFGITQELEKALRPKVWLKSGGYIVINQTEALVAIDINTGKYVGKSNRLEDTIVKINTDAIKEIVRQIRLRDLGGIIVVDFIDMDERKNRQKVMQALEEAMRVDRAPYKILQFNDFGLVAITRKRVKQSLERTLCSPCSYCEGAGYIKSATTIVSEILQEAHKIAKAVEGESTVMLRVNPEVAKLLKSNSNDHLEEIEGILGKTVMVKSDPLLHQSKFDLA